MKVVRNAKAEFIWKWWSAKSQTSLCKMKGSRETRDINLRQQATFTLYKRAWLNNVRTAQTLHCLSYNRLDTWKLNYWQKFNQHACNLL